MEYRELGRTGARTSLTSLGTGGASLMGQRKSDDRPAAVRLVRGALEMGINLFDTAPEYARSEEFLGAALSGRERDGVLIASKFRPYLPDGTVAPAGALVQSVEASLSRLRMEQLDILQLHGVPGDLYPSVRDEHVPALVQLRDRGMVRWLGITERPTTDPRHEMLQRAVADDIFDTVMVAYNILNTSADESVLALAAERGIGVLCMCAVRRAMVNPAHLEQRIREAKDAGHLAEDAVPDREPFGWLLQQVGCSSLPAVAYRFAASDPRIASVLSGTGTLEHLRENVAAMAAGPLPEETISAVRGLFGDVPVSLAE